MVRVICRRKSPGKSRRRSPGIMAAGELSNPVARKPPGVFNRTAQISLTNAAKSTVLEPIRSGTTSNSSIGRFNRLHQKVG
jgi:hypothetical protein